MHARGHTHVCVCVCKHTQAVHMPGFVYPCAVCASVRVCVCLCYRPGTREYVCMQLCVSAMCVCIYTSACASELLAPSPILWMLGQGTNQCEVLSKTGGAVTKATLLEPDWPSPASGQADTKGHPPGVKWPV
jgi:hypothetical protein